MHFHVRNINLSVSNPLLHVLDVNPPLYVILISQSFWVLVNCPFSCSFGCDKKEILVVVAFMLASQIIGISYSTARAFMNSNLKF